MTLIGTFEEVIAGMDGPHPCTTWGLYFATKPQQEVLSKFHKIIIDCAFRGELWVLVEYVFLYEQEVFI